MIKGIFSDGYIYEYILWRIKETFSFNYNINQSWITFYWMNNKILFTINILNISIKEKNPYFIPEEDRFHTKTGSNSLSTSIVDVLYVVVVSLTFTNVRRYWVSAEPVSSTSEVKYEFGFESNVWGVSNSSNFPFPSTYNNKIGS